MGLRLPSFMIWCEPRKSRITTALSTGLSNWFFTLTLMVVCGALANTAAQSTKDNSARKAFMERLSLQVCACCAGAVLSREQRFDGGAQGLLLHDARMIKLHDAAAVYDHERRDGAGAEALKVAGVERHLDAWNLGIKLVIHFLDERGFGSGRGVFFCCRVAVPFGGGDEDQAFGLELGG